MTNIYYVIIGALVTFGAKEFFDWAKKSYKNRINKCPYFKEMHHVSLSVSNVNESEKFYSGYLKLTKIDRPGVFRFGGVWYALPDGKQLHLVENKIDTLRLKKRKNVDDAGKTLSLDELAEGIFEKEGNGEKIPNCHFALRVKNNDCYVELRKNATDVYACKIGHYQGFEQFFVLDPDQNIIEISNLTDEQVKMRPFNYRSQIS